MENMLNSSIGLILLGLKEMEEHRYVYFMIVLLLYLSTLLLSFMVLFVVATEETLQEPMYFLICNLTLGGLYGSSSFLPKLSIDLITSSKMISREACLTQAFCITSYAYFEVSIFTIMAYDRFLAVCHPLQYVILMNKQKIFKLITISLISVFAIVLTLVLLSARLPLCGTQIHNIFCDNMSIFVLSCVETSVNNIYGSSVWVIFFTFTMLVVIYCYLRIFIVCLTIPKSDRHKAFHTLGTHLLNFSIFLVGVLFIFIRYRLGGSKLPLIGHMLLSVNSLVFPPLLNPVIYGIRTKALKAKIVHLVLNMLKKCDVQMDNENVHKNQICCITKKTWIVSSIRS